MENLLLKLEKRIRASPSRLFRAWLQPEEFSRWFHSDASVKLGAVDIDPRPGGRFRIEMFVNGQLRPHEGEYRVVDEPDQLSFTWRSFATGNRDTLVTLTFVAEGESTLITLIQELLSDEAAKRAHQGGWSSILEGLRAWQEDGGRADQPQAKPTTFENT